MVSTPDDETLNLKLETLQREHTQLRRAEQRLKDAVEEKSAILDSLLEHVVYQDTDLNILWANQAACNSVGINREDLAGRHCYEVWAGRTEPCEDCPVQKARDSQKPQTTQKQTPDGRWWHIQGYPVRDQDGHIKGMVELTLDITDAKNAEAKLIEKEILFRTVADFTYDWEYWSDPEQTYLYVSPSCERITGYTAKEFFGDPELIQKITYRDDRTLVSKHIYQEKENQLSHQLDFRIVTRDGRVRWMGHRCQPVYDPNGRYLGRRGSNRDVTDQKNAEQALRQSEEKFRRIVNTAHEGIYVLDSEGKVTFVNGQMAEMVGCTVEEMQGRYLVDFIDDFASVEAYWNTYAANEENPVSRDLHFRGNGDSEMWGMVSSSPIYNDNGQFAGALGMVADITERKKAELAVKEANNELKAFIDAVSHDLKNPIISTEMLCNLLLEKYGDKLDDKARRYLQLINASTAQMSRLVSDLLELSKIGQVVPHLAHVEFADLLNRVVSRFQGMLDSDGIELIADEHFPTVYCDADRIYQVLDNLLGNAIRFAKVTDRPKIAVGCEDAGNAYRCYVSDNGPGIDAAQHQRIFDAFQRIPEKGNEEGTGLGLTIVQRLVRRHGGDVWVESEKGKGATFYFTLPKRTQGKDVKPKQT